MMSIKIVRKMILVALALIVFSNVSNWAGEMLQKSMGVIWGLATAAVAIYCRTKASRSISTNKKYLLWMAIPGVLATIPIVAHVYEFFSKETTWLVRCWEIFPIVIGFIAPVILLWIAYSSLERHSANELNSDKSFPSK